MRRRAYLIPIGLLTLITAGTGTALAHWCTHGAGTGQARTATLNAPGDRDRHAQARGRRRRLGQGQTLGRRPHATGYYVTRIKSTGSTSAACGTSPSATITAMRCTDNPSTAGNYRYRVTAVYANWTTVSATSDQVTIVVAGLAETTAGSPAATAVDPTQPSGATTTAVPPKTQSPPTHASADHAAARAAELPEPPAATDPPTPTDPVTAPSTTP